MARHRDKERDAGLAREALELAQTRYLAWLRSEAPAWEESKPDRKAFNRLGAAARELDAALAPFLGASPQASALLGAMQHAEGSTSPRVHYRRLIDTLPEILMLLDAASARFGGAGLTSNLRTRAWAWFAADAWHAAFHEEPSAAERGRFWRALEAFQSGSNSRSHELPQLGRDSLRYYLRLWKASRSPT